MTQKVKYPEFILAIARDSLKAANLHEGFNTISLDYFVKTVQSGITIRERNHLDESWNWGENYKGDRNYSQWLNYFVVENDDNTINPYMRSRESSGESDLKGRGSIGVGGHTDFVDIRAYNSVIYLRPTALRNIYREAFEEMTFYVNGVKFQAYANEDTDNERLTATLQDLQRMTHLYYEGIMFDNSDNVGRLHFACAWRLKLKPGVTIGRREKALDFVAPVAVENLFTAYPNVTFENWSRIFAERIQGRADARLDTSFKYADPMDYFVGPDQEV